MWTDFSTEFFVGSFWEQAYNRNHLHLAAWNIFIYIFFKIMIYRSMENSPYQCSGFPPWLLILLMPTVDWHRQMDIGHGFARANTSLAGPTGPWRKEHNLNGCNLQTNSNETSAALETTVPKNTKENVPQNTKENADQNGTRFPVGWRKRLQTTCKCCQKDTIILATSTSLYILAVNLVEILTHLRILIEQS